MIGSGETSGYSSWYKANQTITESEGNLRHSTSSCQSIMKHSIKRKNVEADVFMMSHHFFQKVMWPTF